MAQQLAASAAEPPKAAQVWGSALWWFVFCMLVSRVASPAMQSLLLAKLWVSSIGHVRHAPSVAVNPMDAAISFVSDMPAFLAAA